MSRLKVGTLRADDPRMTLPTLGRSRPRPARPRTRAAGPRAGVPALVELTSSYTIRRTREGRPVYFRRVVMRHPDGTLWTHYVREAAA